MRLDHLLSKEHFGCQALSGGPRAISSANVRRWLLKGGTLTIRPGSRVGGCEYCSSERGKHDLRAEPGRARCWVSEGTAEMVAFSADPSALGSVGPG